MKALAMADLHGNLPNVEAYLDDTDVVLIAGDIAPGYPSQFQTEWFNTEFYRWANTLNKPIYGCYGNHDYGTMTVNHPRIQLHVNNFEDNFYMFSWTKEFMGWNYMVKDFDDDAPVNATPGSIESRLSNVLLGNLRKAPPVWVCHGPPFGVCDGNSCGSRALREAIEKYQPQAVFVGHIHDGDRIGRIGTTKIYNCSLVDNALNLINEPIIVDIGKIADSTSA
jgi:Icc-related predicted phosphoesterase